MVYSSYNYIQWDCLCYNWSLSLINSPTKKCFTILIQTNINGLFSNFQTLLLNFPAKPREVWPQRFATVLLLLHRVQCIRCQLSGLEDFGIVQCVAQCRPWDQCRIGAGCCTRCPICFPTENCCLDKQCVCFFLTTNNNLLTEITKC